MLQVTVAYSPVPRQVREWTVDMPSGSSVRQALVQCGVLTEFSDVELGSLNVGIWGKRYSLAHKLKENDRVEIYRPLRVDPKVARRERFTRQGAKRAGLFANKRVGAKAGYGG
jgi:putative ubiquitin-RnfH superfamily antitoxin RatB of RatAB toxin-antitoxin module